jgi:hypothetical protein
MTRLLIPLLLAACTLTLHADRNTEYRTFTDGDGRKISAVLIRATDAEVWIRRNDGQTFQVSLDRFSDADRKFVAEWRRMEALTAPMALEFSARRFPDGRQTTSTESTVTITERYGYVVTITNRSPYDLKDLQVEYRYFIREGNVGATGQNRRIRHEDGRTRIDNLPSRGNTEFKTNTVTLRSSRLKPDWSYRDTNQRRTQDDLRGICVRVRENGKIIAEFSNPGNLMESEKW